ncbi:hypothetical protein PPL_05119 [Heterostelium album PN500]|uniref:Uncharacterized protein n=1 Tax=Heterostelium pallidum (strain ATCC 26659 / Pp 5 / PN500) TaxID=670386 RepID=D3B9H5_HETP5|nr:hypothetical protein PPL_05119 [Heterostelium album PN500]EFA81887.1 hypothetical protein PPL_05119 [Heterostelium album PN500]|eukprot:XP_020434004.1 hypothetical protein PPL_05119 [Heterostelium album PN500]
MKMTTCRTYWSFTVVGENDICVDLHHHYHHQEMICKVPTLMLNEIEDGVKSTR